MPKAVSRFGYPVVPALYIYCHYRNLYHVTSIRHFKYRFGLCNLRVPIVLFMMYKKNSTNSIRLFFKLIDVLIVIFFAINPNNIKKVNY
jgi:hypothetical protein